MANAVETTAKEMAEKAGVSEKSFRDALRAAGLEWHSPYERWTVVVGSPEHAAMEGVLAHMLRQGRANSN